MARLHAKDNKYAAVSVAVGEKVAGGYSLDDELDSPALFYAPSSVTGDVKVKMADGRDVTADAQVLTDVNAHVVKVYSTGTTITTSDFYLWV